ncbi:MAG: class I SAM-dependent methyltransferase, partial [Deltaproteobacteria bacterium]|nr:class I SAM-dependent methyltransferase [Deltaproteobacteria bacterium]
MSTGAAPGVDRCPLCDGQGRAFRRKAGYPILRCAACDVAFVPPRLVPDDLESLYSRAYFEGDADTGYPGYLADGAILRKNFADRLAFVERVGCPGPRLLDVGAAYGLLLLEARARGFEPEGVEIAPDCAEEAARLSGARVACGSFVDVPLEGPYDVIVMLDVIEHFRDPLAAMRRAHELLVRGGLLVMETGDMDSRWARAAADRWHFLDPPQHLFYFGLEGMKRTLRTAGFTSEIAVKRASRRVSVNNLAFKLAARLPGGAARRGLQAAVRRGLPGSVHLNLW